MVERAPRASAAATVVREAAGMGNAMKIALPEITEKMVTEQIIGWLRAKGWLCVRLQSGLVDLPGGRKMRVGALGLPDWCVFKRQHYCFIEIKRPGRELGPEQVRWFADAKRDKINCLWADGFGTFLARWENEPWICLACQKGEQHQERRA